MKSLEKIIAVMLSLLMAMSVLVIAVSADDANTVPQYGKAGGYLAIGDSIGRGCGADGFYLDRDKAADGGQYDLYELRNVEGCYPYLVAQAVGCTAPSDITDPNATYWPLTYPGMTTAVAMDVFGFDDDYTDTKLNYAYYDDVLKYFGYEGSSVGANGEEYVAGKCGLCGNCVELAKNADLITVELGMCDIFYRAYRIISEGGFLADGLSFDLSSPEKIIDLVKTAIELMYEGYDNWQTWYPVLISNLKELNPDATIVMVGSFNLVNQMTINEEYYIPIGTAFSTITDSMNKQYEAWADELGVLYANVENTETLATESDWTLLDDFMEGNNSFPGSHPSQNGHDYMARQILSTLTVKEPTTDIIIDIGRFESIDYILVNGCPIYKYEVNDHILTVLYNGKDATNVTIGIVNEDRTVAVQTYDLSYENGGYVAYRVYGTNDFEGSIKKFLNAIKNIFQKLFDLISGLFS